jgi:release factor glutamine methyltransferase
MTPLRSLVSGGAERLSLGTQPDRARPDAETLLLHFLEKNKAWLIAHLEEELSEAEARPYTALIERRYHGEPIQYITGQAEFYGLPFRVRPGVLIPRPETEHLVEKVIELAARFQSPRIADIGTGSGCIAIALAHHLPHATIIASDLSAAAIAIARENAALNQVSDRICFPEGDLLTPATGQLFEIIVSNPPYVPTANRSSLSIEVRDHEPAIALFAGVDGLDVYRRLIPEAFACLSPGGFIALEIGYSQSSAIAELLEGSGFYSIEFVSDLQSIPRVAVAQLPSTIPQPPLTC